MTDSARKSLPVSGMRARQPTSPIVPPVQQDDVTAQTRAHPSARVARGTACSQAVFEDRLFLWRRKVE
jgi:hypothetical protein